MGTNTHTDQLLQAGDFTALAAYFIGKNPNELKVFYLQKKKNNLFSKPAFWQSPLPAVHLQYILQSSLRVDFVGAFFGKESFYNAEILRLFYQTTPVLTLQAFKRSDCFGLPAYLEYWEKLMDEKNYGLADFCLAIRQVMQVQAKQKKEWDLLARSFNEYPFDLVLWALTRLIDSQKSTMVNDWSFVVANVMTWVEVLGKLLPILNKQKSAFPQPKDFDDANILYWTQAQENDHEKAILQINQLLVSACELHYTDSFIELFRSSFADHSLQNGGSILQTNHQFSQYKKNGKKSIYRETPFLNPLDINKPTSQIAKAYWRYYGITEHITKDGQEIDLLKCHELLEDLSHTLPAKKAYDERFGPHQNMTLYSIEEFKNNLRQYYAWTAQEVDTVFNFLCVDLSQISIPITLLHTPLFCWKDNLYWLGGMMRHRDWKNLLYNKIKTSDIKTNAMDTAFEKALALKFESTGYQILHSHSINRQGQQGEIDVLAYKNGELVIVEAKAGSFTDDIKYTEYLQRVRIEGNAAEQIEKVMDLLEWDWENIRQKLGILKEFHEMDILPLIVTNNFVGDTEKFKNHIRKISFLELDCILDGSNKKLLESADGLPFWKMMAIFNQNNIQHKETNNYDPITVYTGEINNIKIKDCIDNNRVWKFIDQEWQFTPLTMKVG